MSDIDQSFLEMYHAYTNPNWFTRGKEGASAQFFMWHKRGLADLKLLRDEIAQLRAELAKLEELNRMQLAAIAVAALMNTRTAWEGQRINKGNPYWTPAYDDTCIAVDREIRERERAEKAEAELAAMTADRDVWQTDAMIARAENNIARARLGGEIERRKEQKSVYRYISPIGTVSGKDRRKHD